ncbi:MAG: methyltransferase domain-containing protein [Elusimicrobiota bacterium]|nr:MAG: methyltransferase domain-containing protein [Elusimicrobiota bacterium]
MAALAHQGGPLSEPRSCPGCARGGPFSFVEPWHDRIGGGDYSVWSCAGCGLVFSEPRVPPPADWYAKAAPLRAKEERPLPETDWRFRQFLGEGLAPGRILDVGCGDGGFLGLAKFAGWSGVGVDYDERVIARAKERGLDAHADDLVRFLKQQMPGEFDAAVLFDVLEHTPEPAELLGAVAPLLKKGGIWP